MSVVGMIGEHKTRYRLCWIIRGSQGWVKDLDTIIDVSVHMNEDQVAEAETAGYDF